MDYLMSNVLLLPGNKTFADGKVLPLWAESGDQRSQDEEQAEIRLPRTDERLSSPTSKSKVSFDVEKDMQSNRAVAKRRTSVVSSRKSSSSRRKSVVEVKQAEPERVTTALDQHNETKCSVEELWQFVRNVSVNAGSDQADSGIGKMSLQHKQVLYQAVQSGDVDLVDEMLLQLPHADINMTWYSENLLMAAIRAGKTEVALFLLDNGIDYKMRSIRLEVTSSGHLTRFPMSCRQMAYDRGMTQVIDLIDELSGNTWPQLRSLHPAQSRRVVRMRRTVKLEVASVTEVDGSSGTKTDVCSAGVTTTLAGNELAYRTTQLTSQQASPSTGISQSTSGVNHPLSSVSTMSTARLADQPVYTVFAPPRTRDAVVRSADWMRRSRSTSSCWEQDDSTDFRYSRLRLRSSAASFPGSASYRCNDSIDGCPITDCSSVVTIPVNSCTKTNFSQCRPTYGTSDVVDSMMVSSKCCKNNVNVLDGDQQQSTSSEPVSRVRVACPWKNDDPETICLLLRRAQLHGKIRGTNGRYRRKARGEVVLSAPILSCR